MPKRMIKKNYNVSSVHITCVANGFVVNPEYDDLYSNKDKSMIASTVTEAIKYAQVFLTKPHVEEEETYD